MMMLRSKKTVGNILCMDNSGINTDFHFIVSVNAVYQYVKFADKMIMKTG